jgi:hypothetical protein
MTEKNLVIVATLGTIPLPMPHLFCHFPTVLVPFLIFEREAIFPYLFEPQCTQLVVAQSLGPAVLHLSRLNQELVYNRPAAIIEPSSPRSWVLYPTAQIERIYQNEKVEKLQKRPSESENNCELVSAKKKTFENNYLQGRSRMGMPLRYVHYLLCVQ